MTKETKHQITKNEILKLNIPLPTTKIQQVISRQIGHPLGSWIISKPTRKHKYIVEVYK